MAPKISITLPSIYPAALHRSLSNIRATTAGPHEIIVVSQFEVSGENIKWIKETEKRGCAFAHSVAAQYATGDFITPTADDCDYLPGWDERVIQIYNERAPKDGRPFLLGLHYGLIGTVFGIYYANFPFLRRDHAMNIGYFDGNYRTGFTDSDLSLKIWSAGGRCEYSVERLIEITAEDKRKGGEDCPADDLGYFVKKWRWKYGWRFDTSYMRAINVDFDPELNPEFIKDRTVFNNRPSFVRQMALYSPPHLIQSIGEMNIVRYKGEFLVVPWSIGPIDLRTPEGRNNPAIITCRTIAGARRRAARPPRRQGNRI
jgi:glycosyltransferase involved in cell wall biosynthesis